MIYTILKYLFFIIGVLAGFAASYDMLVQAYPDFGILGFTGWFVMTAMFFPLAPLYPGIVSGNWMFLIVCYSAFAIGVILGNQVKKSHN